MLETRLNNNRMQLNQFIIEAFNNQNTIIKHKTIKATNTINL